MDLELKTEPVPAETIARWQLEIGLLRMEAGEHLPLDTAINPYTDADDRLYFLLDDGTVIWLAADGSAMADKRLDDGAHRVTVYRAGQVIDSCELRA